MTRRQGRGGASTPAAPTKRLAVRTAKKARRHHIARRPLKGQRKVVVQRPRPHKPAAAPKLAPKVALASPSGGAEQEVAVDRGRAGGQHGVASYYWQGQRVASGGWFDPNAMTAAHKTLPFGTRVRVTHLGNGRSVEVKINDRGPFIAGRIIDLSKGAAGVIGMTAQGVARVAVEVLGR